MILAKWAADNRLKVKKDTDDSPIIPGKSGSIWAYSKDLLGLSFWGTLKMWNRRRDQAAAMGIRITQDGDTEGNMAFDPRDPEHSAFAIKVAGVRRGRAAATATERQRLAGISPERFRPTLIGPYLALKPTITPSGVYGEPPKC